MTLRRAVLALSLVALAAPAAARPSQSAPSPPPPAPGTAAPEQPTTPPIATRSARPDETPIDPLAIAFDISPDHDAADAAGPKLVKYVIDFVPSAGAAGKSHTLDLGKPKPVEGSISVPLSKVLVPGTYVAHVRAIGRGLQTNTVTVGPFVITEKIGKTKEEIEKELRAPDKPQDKRTNTKKPKTRTQTESDAPAAAPRDTEPPSNDDTKAVKEGKDGKDGSKPANKGGFWKKFYEKVVGEPPSDPR
jgi:hypothetical protein